MSESLTWSVIGHGMVGKELARQVSQPEVAERLGLSQFPEFVMRSSGIVNLEGGKYDGAERLEDIRPVPNVNFIALPSTDDGLVAYEYMEYLLNRGSTVITAEKGALANFYSQLETKSDNFRLLGMRAAVGGGTRMLNIAQEYCRDRDNITQIHISPNGTLNSIFSSTAPSVGQGMSLGQSVRHAVELGYAEPGAQSPIDVIRGEIEGDIAKKTAIFLNAVGLVDGPVTHNEIDINVSDDEIRRAAREAGIRRYIVSIYPKGQVDLPELEEETIAFHYNDFGNLIVFGGFQHIERNPLLAHFKNITGPGNGMVIGLGPDESDGVYTLSGPGAGPRPTANAMLDDYLEKKEQ